MLPHPAHLDQLHFFTVYAVDDGARATRFAATELSNGVWGFYRWIVAADPADGASADGSLRFEHDLGPLVAGRYDATAPVARLYDAASGARLFDGTAWASSRIVPQPEGDLLLSLHHGELQTLFRIDPPASAFEDLAGSGPARPLADLADAAAAARAACDTPASAYHGRRIAPDGSLLVETQAVEWSNTHWVHSPRVVEVATGRVLLDLWGTDWDAEASFPRRRAMRLGLRRYHFGGGAEVEIELGPDRFILFDGGGAHIGALADLPAALEEAARRAVGEAPQQVAPPRPRPRPTLRNWLVALLILVLTLGLIAAATAISLHLQGDAPPQKLDVVPPMPRLSTPQMPAIPRAP